MSIKSMSCFKFFFSCLGLWMGMTAHLSAQTSEEVVEDRFFTSSKQDMGIVMGAGGLGALVGLSTLSFVEKPGDEFDNIMVGGALGLIAGVIYVAFDQATKGQRFYGKEVVKESELLPPMKSLVADQGGLSGQQLSWTFRF